MSHLPGPVQIQGVDTDGNPVAIVIDSNGRMKIMLDRTTVTQPVSDAGSSLTVDGTVSVSNLPSVQPVTGTVAISGTVPVSIASAPVIAVTGAFWQAAQPVSAVALPLPSGAATSADVQAVVDAISHPTMSTPFEMEHLDTLRSMLRALNRIETHLSLLSGEDLGDEHEDR